MIKDENYFIVQGWMVNRLKLSGNELLVYAVIYGFTQDGENWFEGSRQYIAELTGMCKRTVDAVLDRLCESGKIKKEDYTVRGIAFCRYRAILPDEQLQHPLQNLQLQHPLQNLRSPIAESAPNNKVDNKEDPPQKSACAHVCENHPSGYQDVIDYAASCEVPINQEQAELFISKNSATAVNGTWQMNRNPVQNWKRVADLWLPGWRKDFIDKKKSEPKKPKRNPEKEAAGYRFIESLGRYETTFEKEEREIMGHNAYFRN